MMCMTADSANNAGPIWKLIVFGHQEEFPAYLETRTYQRNTTEKSDMAFGQILLSPENPIGVVYKDTPVVSRSQLRVIIVDCKNAIAFVKTEVHFAVRMPDADSVPVAVFEHEEKQENFHQISKISVIYLTLCPVYV